MDNPFFTILDVDDQKMSILIEDDGRGFDPLQMPEEPALTVKAIKERAEMLGGSFDVQSSPGSGSKFAISIPLA